MTHNKQQHILDKAVQKAVANGWQAGTVFLSENKELPFSEIIFCTGFGRALWGEEMIVLRDIKTTRGQTISEEAWRFHQHIILDFLQLAREDLAHEYLEQFLQ